MAIAVTEILLALKGDALADVAVDRAITERYVIITAMRVEDVMGSLADEFIRLKAQQGTGRWVDQLNHPLIVHHIQTIGHRVGNGFQIAPFTIQGSLATDQAFNQEPACAQK